MVLRMSQNKYLNYHHPIEGDHRAPIWAYYISVVGVFAGLGICSIPFLLDRATIGSAVFFSVVGLPLAVPAVYSLWSLRRTIARVKDGRVVLQYGLRRVCLPIEKIGGVYRSLGHIILVKVDGTRESFPCYFERPRDFERRVKEAILRDISDTSASP